jgi:hypothetical protein
MIKVTTYCNISKLTVDCPCVKFVLNEAQSLLGCTAVFLIGCLPTFQRCILPPSSTAGVISGLLPGAEKAGEDL